MSVVFEVLTPAATTSLTTPARARAKLNLDASKYDDTFLESLIDSASAAIVSWLNVARDGVAAATLARETARESFCDLCLRDGSPLLLARAPVTDVISVEEDGATTPRQLEGADGAIAAASTAFASVAGPGGGAFAAVHVGKTIVVAGAGAAGAPLTTTIAAIVDDDNATLADAAATSVAGAAYTLENPSFDFEWRRGASQLWKLSGGYRAPWSAGLVRVVYEAGYVLPTDVAAGTLPRAIEDAAILLARRKLDQFRECDNPRVKSESWAGIGAWTFDLTPIDWIAGITSDVAAMLQRYRRVPL